MAGWGTQRPDLKLVFGRVSCVVTTGAQSLPFLSDVLYCKRTQDLGIWGLMR
jgi:hypothetical protein